MCLAVPGRIVEIRGNGADRTGTVDFNGVQRAVSLAFVSDAAVGDYVLVHVGFALSRIDEQIAQETLAVLRQIGGAEEWIDEETGHAPPG